VSIPIALSATLVPTWTTQFVSEGLNTNGTGGVKLNVHDCNTVPREVRQSFL
jgi:hypothetical protein